MTGDGSGVTFKQPKIKEEKKKMYKREDFKIVDGFNLNSVPKFHVKLKDKYLWLSTDGGLSEGGNKDYNFWIRGDAIKALDEFLESQNSTLELKFVHDDKKLGVVGTPTPITDLRGEELCVGDCVELFFRSGVEHTNCAICKDEYGKFQVMGLYGAEFENGFSSNGSNTQYAILKSKSYKDLKVGDAIGSVEVVETKSAKELTIAEIEKELGFKVKVVGND